MREQGGWRADFHSRSWSLALIGIGMIIYVMLVGRHLGSSFFLSAMCWGWVAMCGLLGRLGAARDMALVMAVLTLIAILAVLAAGKAGGGLLTLGLLPTLIVWGCVALYIRHLQSPSLRE